MSLPIYLLTAVTFVDLLAVGLIVPIVPSRVRNLGGNEIDVGLLGTIYAGCQLISGPVIGSLSDLKGRRPILAMTLIVSSIAYVYLSIVDSIFVVLLIRGILGVFKQTQVLSRALVPEYERNQQNQGAIYGKMAAISGGGITLGPLISGHILEDYPDDGYLRVGILVGLCFALNACIVQFILPNPASSTKKEAQQSQEEITSLIYKLYTSLHQSIVQLYHIEWSKYWDIFMFKVLVSFAMGTFYSNYAIYLTTQYELSPKYIGYVISFQGIIGSICCYFIGFINSFYKNDKDYTTRNFHVFLLLSIALMGMLLSFNVLIYSFWLIPLAIGNAIGRLVTLEMVLKRCDKRHTGTLIGASNSVRSMAGVVAPMVAGIIAQYIGITYVIYASLFSTLIGLVLSYRHRLKLKED